MYYSDMINVKSHFEILFNMQVNDIIQHNNHQTNLKTFIRVKR